MPATAWERYAVAPVMYNVFVTAIAELAIANVAIADSNAATLLIFIFCLLFVWFFQKTASRIRVTPRLTFHNAPHYRNSHPETLAFRGHSLPEDGHATTCSNTLRDKWFGKP
jgi:hypothetical protein